jgi:hypothetical protein
MAVAAAGCGRASSVPTGLTDFGRTQWNFEALLRDTLGERDVCVNRDRPAIGLSYRADCSEAVGGLYIFTFANPRHSAFHLAKRRLPVAATYGAHAARPVRIDGHVVACDANEREIVMTSVAPLFCSELP